MLIRKYSQVRLCAACQDAPQTLLPRAEACEDCAEIIAAQAAVNRQREQDEADERYRVSASNTAIEETMVEVIAELGAAVARAAYEELEQEGWEHPADVAERAAAASAAADAVAAAAAAGGGGGGAEAQADEEQGAAPESSQPASALP